MTLTERRASVSLSSIYALRLLGLFLVLPVFALKRPVTRAAMTRRASGWPWVFMA